MIILNGLTVESDVGRTKGYHLHAVETIKALKRFGCKFAEEDDEPDLVLHQMPSFAVKKVLDIPNVLYTAYEAPDLPEMYVEGAREMDLIVCTSTFTTKVYKKHLPNKLCFTVPLGIDPNVFTYKRRRYSEPFIYLWVGAPNERKGWHLIQEAWRFFENDPSVRLHLQTSGAKFGFKQKNVVLDTNDLSRENLANLFHKAHCFIFPSYGEGWGLPLAEGMATGLPCVFTPWSGMTDYANSKNAYPLHYKIVFVEYGVKTLAAKSDVDDLIEKMIDIKNNYHKACVRGRNAAETMHHYFTWDHTGRKMKRLLEDFLNGKLN